MQIQGAAFWREREAYRPAPGFSGHAKGDEWGSHQCHETLPKPTHARSRPTHIMHHTVGLVPWRHSLRTDILGRVCGWAGRGQSRSNGKPGQFPAFSTPHWTSQAGLAKAPSKRRSLLWQALKEARKELCLTKCYVSHVEPWGLALKEADIRDPVGSGGPRA